jgi:hypothetical protein
LLTRIRTKVFFLLGILNLCTAVVVPSISAWLMDRCGPLFTYSLSVPVLLIPLFVLVFMPSTSSRSEALEELDADETPQPETPDSGMLSKGLNFFTKRLLGACRYIRQRCSPHAHVHSNSPRTLWNSCCYLFRKVRRRLATVHARSLQLEL